MNVPVLLDFQIQINSNNFWALGMAKRYSTDPFPFLHIKPPGQQSIPDESQPNKEIKIDRLMLEIVNDNKTDCTLTDYVSFFVSNFDKV